MNLEQRTSAFIQLGQRMQESIEETGEEPGLFNPGELYAAIQASNPWFTTYNTKEALLGIIELLKETAIITWLKAYPWLDQAVDSTPVTAVVMAGNIPAVGFHDLFCVLMAGHIVLIRTSSKDRILPAKICEWLLQIEPQFSQKIRFTEGPLGSVDAVIATGSNNTSRYFEHYFGKTRHIFRKNRFSIAILDGLEQPEDFEHLATDVFTYFGMGCRSVSRILIPDGFPPERLLPALCAWNHLASHSKYFNNYEYNKAIALLNREDFYDGGFFLLKQAPGDVPPPLAVIYFSYYKSESDLLLQVKHLEHDLQCVVHGGRPAIAGIPFGTAQHPGPGDYADGIDTLEFLRSVTVNPAHAQ
jgi:hypothetical protein